MEFRKGTLHIGGVSVNDIVDRFGTPAYIYDASQILGQIANVRRAFSGLPLRPFYAMKANSSLALLRLIRKTVSAATRFHPARFFSPSMPAICRRRSGSRAR